jgi:GT2 family glycosyltransferase
MKMKVAVVIPNWNGADMIAACLTALEAQSYEHDVVVVDNGSVDNSVQIIEDQFPDITLLKNKKNLGFAGGVNTGIRYALDTNFDAIALLNNDAITDEAWLENLVVNLEKFPEAGIVTCKLLGGDGSHIDSTGDIYTTWGIPYPRGRDEPTSDKYDTDQWIFGASGGASLYRAAMLREIGLFDEDFFAYYEDVDISFRAQLAGWKVRYEPKATVNHTTSSTGSKIPGFFTYQTIKNYPLIFWKNVPTSLLPMMLPRFTLAHAIFELKGLLTPSRTVPTIKGILKALSLMPKKLRERKSIQKNRKVTDDYIKSMLTWDLPPNAHKLRSLRTQWWRIVGKR